MSCDNNSMCTFQFRSEVSVQFPWCYLQCSVAMQDTLLQVNQDLVGGEEWREECNNCKCVKGIIHVNVQRKICVQTCQRVHKPFSKFLNLDFLSFQALCVKL